ncbi:hypothetical protein L6452_32539 [Arctium lappa]|uniref:Uncharacterized protein n=1 Tax=Arctium lappa TaxID=4217 RepID=A0ACB8Z4L2_ARCLA|nr:hypothetical protein L6452_32539 [Arctium lappa]
MSIALFQCRELGWKIDGCLTILIMGNDLISDFKLLTICITEISPFNQANLSTFTIVGYHGLATCRKD